ncbi:MAG: hypothetical protein M1820_010356 [Bogoriella megaspora]|nr:MAG: hypothetical protein M1820_010356 [Bogoriella megaspora]
MAKLLVTALLATFWHISNVAAIPTSNDFQHPSNGVCTRYTVREEVASSDPVWGLPKFQDNYDVMSFLVNFSRKDSATAFHPISGYQNVTKTYEVAGTFCTPTSPKNGKEKTVLLASHGIWYDGRYWASSYKPDEYNFVQYALANGYSIFYYDRVGVGKSEKVSGYEISASSQVELLVKITRSVRAGKYTSDITASKVVLVGHSFGSYISHAGIAKYPDLAEGAVLTGTAYANATDAIPFAISFISFAPRLATTVNPPFDRDSGYLGFGDIYAHTSAFFHEPYDIPTIEYAQSIYQPAAVLEFVSLTSLNLNASAFKGKVLVTTGEFDFPACGGECKSTYQGGVADLLFSGTKPETYIHPGAGHGVNFAANATGFFGRIVAFLDGNF